MTLMGWGESRRCAQEFWKNVCRAVPDSIGLADSRDESRDRLPGKLEFPPEEEPAGGSDLGEDRPNIASMTFDDYLMTEKRTREDDPSVPAKVFLLGVSFSRESPLAALAAF